MPERAKKAQRIAAPALLALFFLLFLTELDRELIRRGFPVPGVFLFAASMGGFAVWALAPRLGPAPGDARKHALELLRRRWPFLLALALLALLTWIQWPRNPDAVLRDALPPLVALAMAAAAMTLPLASGVRRRWRLFLRAALLFYCCTVFIDVLWPATFTLLAYRAAGLAIDPNVGAFMVLILATPLLSYRRISWGSIGVLYVAGLAAFMTLSRSGLSGYAVLFAAYFAWTLWTGQGRRLLALGGFAGVGALLAASCWLSIQTLPYFDSPGAVDRLNQLAGRELFTYNVPIESDSDYWMLGFRLGEYKEYTRVVEVVESRAAAPSPPRPPSAARAASEPGEPELGEPEQAEPERAAPSDPEPAVAAPAALPDPDAAYENVRAPVESDVEARVEARILGDNIRVTDDAISVDVPRLVHLKNAWRLIRLSPVWGYGAAFSIQNGVEPHLMFLLTWINLGVFGFLLYAVLLATGFWIFIRDRFWPGVFLMGLIAYFSMFSQTILESRPLFVLLGLLMGLPLALRRYGDADPELPATETR